MSLLEELFGLDEAEEAEALERVIEGGSDHDEPPGDPDDEAEEDKRKVDPSKPKSVRVVKNPQVVLNAARLTGPRGMQALPEHFKDFKFKGKGHEKEDLDMVLKKLEHWAHRLYPKYQFDDSLKKIETLGNKRPVLVMLRKIRSDQMISDEVVTHRDSSDDETPPEQQDEFDILLGQQIELARATPHVTPASVARPSLAPKATSSPSINEEQKIRMLRNKQLAEERRRKKNVTNEIVDLTGFNQEVSVGLNGGGDSLVDKSNTMNVDECSIDVLDLTEKPIDKENITPNQNNVIECNDNEVADENDKILSVVTEGTDENCDVEMSETVNSESEIKLCETKNKSNNSSNGSKEIPLYYSDSSDDDLEMTTVNVAISADVHNDCVLQESQNVESDRATVDTNVIVHTDNLNVDMSENVENNEESKTDNKDNFPNENNEIDDEDWDSIMNV